jgi:hypothetical protein
MQLRTTSRDHTVTDHGHERACRGSAYGGAGGFAPVDLLAIKPDGTLKWTFATQGDLAATSVLGPPAGFTSIQATAPDHLFHPRAQREEAKIIRDWA